MKKSIAIIPARGGSKRIPRKNIKDFLGKPIITYPIKVAIDSGLFDKVIVSTDDKEIAEIAQTAGATFFGLRPTNISNDIASLPEVVVREIQINKLDKFEYVSCIFATAALLTAEDLKRAHFNLISSENDCLLPVVENEYYPQRSYYVKNNRLNLLMPQYKYTRSQQLKKTYREAGCFWICRVEYLLNNDFFNANMIPFIMFENNTQDIDNDKDWQSAERKYRKLNEL